MTDVSMKTKIRWAKMNAMIESAEEIAKSGKEYKKAFSSDDDCETAEKKLELIWQEMYKNIQRLNQVRPSENM